MRNPIDLKAAIDALTQPRFVHTTQSAPTADDPKRIRVVTIEHPPLIDLLEHGTGTSRGSSGAGGGGMPGPIDAGALETWAQIRDQVRAWLKQLRAPWSDDLKADLRTWWEHHDWAACHGRVRGEALEVIERTVESWQLRIEAKYSPDERREWTEPCPAVLRTDVVTGEAHRCGARRIRVGGTTQGGRIIGGTLQFAIALNVTRLEAECRACGTRWEGERELRMLRYETNLVDLERTLAVAAEAEQRADRSRDLTLTGPIDLP